MPRTRVPVLALLSLAIGYGGCDCGADAGLPTSRIDSGFVMARDSFAFENFGGASPDSRVNEDLLIRLHGKDAVCAADEADCRIRPLAKQFMRAVNDSLRGGRCEGFAVLSGLLQTGDADTTGRLGATTASSMAIEENAALGQELAYWFSTQYLRDVVRLSTRALGAEEAVRFLAATFAESPGRMFRLGIARVDDEGRLTGGHAVVPIAVGPGDSEDEFVIWVYDNNQPGAERELRVNVARDQWQYSASANPDENGALYVGDSANRNVLYLAEIAPRLGRHSCSYCAEDDDGGAMQHVFGSAGVEVRSTDGDGQTTGESMGAVLAEIPGSVAVPLLSADLWMDDTGVQSFIPVAGPLTTIVRASGTAEQAGSQRVTVFAENTVASLNDFRIGADSEITLTVDVTGPHVTLESPPDTGGELTLGGVTTSGDEALVTVGLPDAGATTAAVRLDRATGRVSIEATTDQAEEDFFLTVTLSNTEEDNVFTGVVRIPRDGVATLLLDEWGGDGEPLGVELDTDGDGQSDVTVSAPDEGEEAVPPAAPSELVAAEGAPGSVTLTWRDNADNEATFQLERDDGAGFIPLASVASGTTTYADEGLAPTLLYRYRVRARNQFGASAFSNVAELLLAGCEPGSAVSGQVCEACVPGEFCPGGAASRTDCPLGTTDDDADPATPCVPCPLGTFDDDGDPLTACVPVLDAGPVDAGQGDAGQGDAGSIDGGDADAGAVDAGLLDAGFDAGPPTCTLAADDCVAVVVESALGAPAALELHAGFLYWAHAAPGECVYRTPATGGVVDTIACAEAGFSPFALAVNDTYVAFGATASDFSDRLYLVDNAPGQAPTTIGINVIHSTTSFGPWGVELLADEVWWMRQGAGNNENIRRLDPVPPDEVSYVLQNPFAQGFELAPERVFWTEADGDVRSAPLPAVRGDPNSLLTALTLVRLPEAAFHMHATDTHLFIGTRNGTDGALWGGTYTAISDLAVDVDPDDATGYVYAMAHDATYLYWVTDTSGSSSLVRMAQDTPGSVVVMQPSAVVGRAGDVVVDDGFVYWTTDLNGGAIMKTPLPLD